MYLAGCSRLEFEHMNGSWCAVARVFAFVMWGWKALVGRAASILRMSERMKVVDLFSGVGGLSIGFENAGFEVIGASDLEPDITRAFALNHPGALVRTGDIKEMNPGDFMAELGIVPGQLDVLMGGPPCQGFSRNRARRHYEGKFVDDPRNYLFKEFLRFAEAIKPRAVLIENVADMLVKEGGKFKNEIVDKLAELGYLDVNTKVLNAADYGVPQRRRRAFIVASRDGVVQLPSPTHEAPDSPESLFDLPNWVTIGDAISDLPHLSHGEGNSPCVYRTKPLNRYQQKMRGCEQVVTEHIAWPMSKVQEERLSYLAEGEGAEMLPPGLAPKGSYGSAYRRMDRDIPALTITTWLYHPGSGMYYHPTDNRTITLREAARLQSFPDSTQFYGKKIMKCRQVGNAVPPLLAEKIGRQLSLALG